MKYTNWAAPAWPIMNDEPSRLPRAGFTYTYVQKMELNSQTFSP
jgi:hypothetical protein